MKAPSIQLPRPLLYLLLAGGIGLGFVLAFALVRDSRPLRVPSGLAAHREGEEVVLTWQNQSDDEAGFLVERRVAGFSGWEEASTVGPNVTDFRETPPGTAGQYSLYYRVRYYKDRPRLYSPPSEEVKVNPILVKPPPSPSPTKATPMPTSTSTPEPASPRLTVLTPAATGQPSPTPVVKQLGLPAMVDPYELFVINAAGGEPVLLYRGLQPANFVSWSPLGTALAFGNVEETYVVTLPPGRAPELLYPISQSVRGMTWSPDGARFAFSAPGGVHVANLAGEMALVGPLEGTVREMLWSPQGDLLAVATLTGANEWKLLSMSFQTGSPVVELYREMTPAGDRGWRLLSWLPGTSRLLAAKRGKLLTIDLVTKEVSAQDVPPDATVFASPNGSEVALMESGGICPEGPRATSLAFLRLTDSSRTEILKGVCGLSGGVAWSPDGRELAYGIGLGEERGLYVADVVAGRARRLSDGAQKDGQFGDMTWLADSSGLVVTEALGSSGMCPPERYVFMPIQAGSQRVLFTTKGGCIPYSFFGGFAPDSRRYLYASEGVWVGDLRGEAKALLEPDPSYDYGILKWSSAGDSVAFLRASSHLPQRYSINLNTGEITRQAGEFSGIPSAYRELTPQPSPDGTATAFWREIEGGRAVALYVEESGRERTLARFGADAYGRTVVYRKPVWSPEGRRLAIFVEGARPSIGGRIYVVEADGSGLMDVVDTPSFPRIYGDLAWSADGQHILFSFLGIVCC